MGYRGTDPAAATNAFARQVQLGANMRASDQSEEMNALALNQARRADAAAQQPQYDPQTFPKVGQIAAQISTISDPVQKRAAFKQAILANGTLFDTLGMPHADALAKLDTTDDASFEQMLQSLAKFAPQAAPTDVAPGHSLVRPTPGGGFTPAFTAPTAQTAPEGFSLSPGQVRFGPDGKRIAGVDAAPAAAPVTFQNVSELRKEFNNQSVIFRGVADSYQRIQDSAKDPSAAGDLSLIFNYMKVLDPGSTVREGEFATAEQAGSIPARILAKYNKLLSGERLAPEQRADFVDRATRLYQGQEQRFKANVIDRYTGLAKRYGIDPNDIIGKVNAAPAAQPPAPNNEAPGARQRLTPEQAMQLPPGTPFVGMDGTPRVRH